MKLDTIENGFFTSDNKTYIDLSLPKSNPNRAGEVINIKSANLAAYPTLKTVTVKFPDYEADISAFDLDEMNENIHCHYSPVK